MYFSKGQVFSTALKVIHIFRSKKRKNHAEYDTSFVEMKILDKR